MEGKVPPLEAIPPALGGPGAAALEGCGHAFPIAAYFSFILNIICLVATATSSLF